MVHPRHDLAKDSLNEKETSAKKALVAFLIVGSAFLGTGYTIQKIYKKFITPTHKMPTPTPR